MIIHSSIKIVGESKGNEARDEPLTKMKNTATFSINAKTFAVTTAPIARAMVFQGNTYGHDRAKQFTNATDARAFFTARNFTEV